MKQNLIETIVGFAVLIIAFVFLIFAYRTGSSTSDKNGYPLTASFQSAEGIVVGTNVMIAGIKIGSVQKIMLDKDNFFATVYLSINEGIRLPKDSKVSVVTNGLLGGKYIDITPGNDDQYFTPNEVIKYTQSAINVESLINKILSTVGSKK